MIITFGLFTIYGMFLSLATLADVALRDRASRMDEIMRTQPIWTPSYLGAKFAGPYVGASLAAAALPVVPKSVFAADARAKEFRIGYQKAASTLVLLKAHDTLEKRLAPLGIAVKWTEFPAGPQLLE